MQNKKLEISYQLFQSKDELPTDEAALLASAMEATEAAYAPFSEFRVGCAVLLDSGEIILGNNQENRAYPSGLCAERTALFFIGSQSKGKLIRKIAIRVRSDRKTIQTPAMPCGACRQVMVEYEQMADLPFVVLSQGAEGNIMRMEGVRNNLLPFSFDIDF
ncbi:MAG: cytidine deaminase [Bacteroidia bacterium]|nr:cytidine deaminase [Bacteroidota bacterium]